MTTPGQTTRANDTADGTLTSAPERFWNVPNTLTVARLGLGFVVLGLIAYAYYLTALVVFIVVALGDALDGYLARRLNQSTALGRQLDPLVDKVVVLGVFIYLLTIEGTGLAPWMVTAIVIRELLIQGLRSHLEAGGQAFGAKMAGKLKTTAQCLAICAILLSLIVRPGPGWLLARDGLTWLAVGLTVYSGVSYLVVAVTKYRVDAPVTSP